MPIYYDYKLGSYLLANEIAGEAHDDARGLGVYYIGPTPPDVQAVAAWDPAGSVTDVEVAKAQAKKRYLESRVARQGLIDDLMVDVSFAMVMSGAFTSENVDDEGSRFMSAHATPIYAYVMGGNETAQLLYDAIVASVAEFPWLTEDILAIFSAALTPK